jgi:hypothetical protein
MNKLEKKNHNCSWGQMKRAGKGVVHGTKSILLAYFSPLSSHHTTSFTKRFETVSPPCYPKGRHKQNNWQERKGELRIAFY